MTVRLVVFVVLMIFWLLSGAVSGTPGAPSWLPTASTLIPWACVAILGWEVYNGGPRPAG